MRMNEKRRQFPGQTVTRPEGLSLTERLAQQAEAAERNPKADRPIEVSSVARALRLPDYEIRRLIEAGELPHVTTPEGGIRVMRSDVVAYRNGARSLPPRRVWRGPMRWPREPGD